MAFDSEKDTDINLDDKIHKAISARLARLNLDEVVAGAVEKALSKTAPKEDKLVNVDKVSNADKDEIAKLRQEMAEKEAQAAAKIKKQQDKQSLMLLRGELKGKVIHDMDDVVSDWIFQKQLVSVDEEGETKIKIGEEVLALNEGVKKFLSSKEGKRFAVSADATKSVLKPVIDRPAPNGNSHSAGVNVDRSSLLDGVLSDIGLK